MDSGESVSAKLERADPNQPKQGEGVASRGKLRTFLGAEEMRQLILK